ncbi:MAG: GTPase Era [Oscillospiraceae bacterium]|jgi:GTP-binding protein Era|nr:GTPase Era [Oscillospiraceae bacterium]
MINKTAMISVVGRANAGKSTLINKLTGDKVTIVSPKPQTTRNRIFGVFTYEDIQMILLDTPGFHKARNELGNYMVGVVKESIADVDAVILLVEPVANVGTQEMLLIEHIKKTNSKVLLVINKIDTVRMDALLPVIECYSNYYEFDAIIPISAKKGDGINELLKQLASYAKSGPQLFPDGITTDQHEQQIIAEILREKLLLLLDKEIPHGVAVEITRFSERGSEDSPIIDVEATIYYEKKNHKGIIIGKKGEMIKKVGQYARIDMERFMGAKINLQTWVKIKENWRDNHAAIRNLGYLR